MKKTALTKSESEVMYLLWHTDRALSAADIRSLTVAEPDLEEIVLHFYGKGCEQA